MTEALELAAWRFIAAHRVGSLSASHAQFIDSGNECRINTPSQDQDYESAGAPTWGQAAVKLALALGMPWPSQCLAVRSALEGSSSSAPTAILPSGESVKSSRRTRARKTGSTTAATGVARSDGMQADLDLLGERESAES